MVLDGGAVQPDGRRFKQHAAAREDGNLGAGRVVEVVVRGPEPRVLEVGSDGRAGDMDGHVGRHARVGDRSAGGTLGDLEVRSRKAANAGVHVPDTRAAGSVEVILDQYSAGGGALSTDNHIGPLYATSFTRFTDSDNRNGIRGARPKTATR